MLKDEMIHLSVKSKSRDGTVLGIDHNFEKHLMKIYAPKTY